MVRLESGRETGSANQPQEIGRSQSGAPSDFDEEGHRVDLEFEAVKRMKLGEERCWIAPIEGRKDLQWRRKNDKKVRRVMWTLCWLVLKRHKTRPVLVFSDAEKEGSEEGKVLDVRSQSEASLELVLSRAASVKLHVR